jgi:hypothetical protein
MHVGIQQLHTVARMQLPSTSTMHSGNGLMTSSFNAALES